MHLCSLLFNLLLKYNHVYRLYNRSEVRAKIETEREQKRSE